MEVIWPRNMMEDIWPRDMIKDILCSELSGVGRI
jgi:hypothetical protein